MNDNQFGDFKQKLKRKLAREPTRDIKMERGNDEVLRLVSKAQNAK